MAEVTITGLREVLKNMGAATKDIEGAVAAAIWQEGLDILGKSVKQVPVDSGTLKRSAYAAPPKGKDHEVEIGYGTDYALAVHEREEVHHTVGNAKYLQRPFEDAQSGYANRVARRAAVNFKGKVKPGGVNSLYPKTPQS